MRLTRLKRSKVPSDFTLQAAKEDIGKSSSIGVNLILSYLQVSALCVPKLGGKRSATVSEADCDVDRRTVAEHDISTDSTLAMQGPSTSTLKRFCAHMSAVTALFHHKHKHHR